MKSKEIARRLGMLALALGLIPGSSHAQSARPDTKILAAVQACDKDSRALLEKLVSIDSGSGDAEGLGAVGAVEAAELTALGAEVKTVPPPPDVSPRPGRFRRGGTAHIPTSTTPTSTP